MLTYHEPQMKYCRNMKALSLILSEVCMRSGAANLEKFSAGEKEKISEAVTFAPAFPSDPQLCRNSSPPLP